MSIFCDILTHIRRVSLLILLEYKSVFVYHHIFSFPVIFHGIILVETTSNFYWGLWDKTLTSFYNLRLKIYFLFFFLWFFIIIYIKVSKLVIVNVFCCINLVFFVLNGVLPVFFHSLTTALSENLYSLDRSWSWSLISMRYFHFLLQ